jgi:hypothetical protein
MGFISSISSETKVSIAFSSKDVSVVNGVPQPEAWTPVKTVEGLFWTGAQRLGLVSDKLKTSVEGAIAIDYDATIAAMADDSRFTVNSKNYRIIHIDNVGEQNEMLQILYKRELSN